MGMTAVYVTHDQAEAMALATRVAVMDKGRIVQFAPPIEIYRRPATTFVANFVGNPPMNLLPVEAMIEGGRLYIRAEGLHVAGAAGAEGGAAALGEARLTLGVRPEHLAIGDAGPNTITRRALRQREHGAGEARDARARRTPPASPPASSPTRRSRSASA